MLIYQHINVRPSSLDIIGCLDSKGKPDPEKALKKRLKRQRELAISASTVKEIIEGMFSWFPTELDDEFWWAIDNHCDLCIRQAHGMDGLARVDYHFIYRGNDSSSLQFIKDNWHKAWGELFPTMDTEYKKEDLEKAKAYAEANWVSEEMPTTEIGLPLAKAVRNLFGAEENQEYIKKRQAFENYLAENCTEHPLADLSRSRFNNDVSGFYGRIEYVFFDENLSQEEDEKELLWTEIYLEFHKIIGHPVLATAYTKKDTLKIVKALQTTHEQAVNREEPALSNAAMQ
jgi:hypothetical protein